MLIAAERLAYEAADADPIVMLVAARGTFELEHVVERVLLGVDRCKVNDPIEDMSIIAQIRGIRANPCSSAERTRASILSISSPL